MRLDFGNQSFREIIEKQLFPSNGVFYRLLYDIKCQHINKEHIFYSKSSWNVNYSISRLSFNNKFCFPSETSTELLSVFCLCFMKGSKQKEPFVLLSPLTNSACMAATSSPWEYWKSFTTSPDSSQLIQTKLQQDDAGREQRADQKHHLWAKQFNTAFISKQQIWEETWMIEQQENGQENSKYKQGSVVLLCCTITILVWIGKRPSRQDNYIKHREIIYIQFTVKCNFHSYKETKVRVKEHLKTKTPNKQNKSIHLN